MSRLRGDPSRWAELFPEELVPDVLTFIVETWQEFDRPCDAEREPQITRRLRSALGSRLRHTQAVPARVLREMPTDGDDEGLVDICFCHGYSDEEYFGFEAKKLNRPSRHNADEYVGNAGMGCFVSGKYAPKQKHGGMIGYVMDGDCARAIENVRRHIRAHRLPLKLKRRSRVRRSTIVKHLDYVFETQHEVDGRRLLLHHLILAA